MTKKDYVMMTLYTLKDFWSYAPGLITAMENESVSDDAILALYSLLSRAIEEATDKTLRDKLIMTQKYIHRLKDMEMQEESEFGELDQMMRDI